MFAAHNLDAEGIIPLLTAREGMSKDIAKRVEELRARSDLNRAAVAALEVRVAANKLMSPCDCTVFWAAGDGEWVRAGERIFTLVRTRPNDVLVEALVPLRLVERIREDG